MSSVPAYQCYAPTLPRYVVIQLLLCALTASGVGAEIAERESMAEETISIREEQPLHRRVAKVGVHAEAPPPYIATLWSPSGGSSIFDVDKYGVFKLKSRLDRESGATNYAVVLQSLVTFAWVKVAIVVIDINDCPPVFSPDVNVSLTVDETTPPGTRLLLGSVSDRDAPGANSKLRNSLVNYDPVFRLVTSVDPVRESSPVSLYLEVVETLDYELRKRYDMQLVSSDSGVVKQLEVRGR